MTVTKTDIASTKTFMPYLGSPVPVELALRASALVGEIRSDPSGTHLKDESVSVVLALCKAGLDHFFRRPVDLMELGTFGHTITSLGLRSAMAGLSMISNRLVRGLSTTQMIILADIIEDCFVSIEKLESF